MNTKWRRFNSLTGKCYNNMMGIDQDSSCWGAAFELLKDIIRGERSRDAGYAPELYQLDDVTDFVYDIEGWLEDYIGELDMRGMWEELLEVCEDMLEMFAWKEISSSDFDFLRISALGNLGRNEEAVRLSREWMEKEEDNMLAVSSGVYAYMNGGHYEEAEALIEKYIHEDTECTDENDVLFIAAGELYKASGNQEAERRIEKILEEYDEVVEQELMEWDEDEEDPPFS